VSDTVHGYGADAELVGSTLRLTATGKIGRGALGTDTREIAVPELKALSFAPGNMVKNGRLELVDERGKSVVHFRRKGNGEWHSLFDRLAKLAPTGADEVPTDDAPLFSEDAQKSIAAMQVWLEQKGERLDEKLDQLGAWAERKAAEQESKEAAKRAKKAAKDAPRDAPSPPVAAASSPDIAEQIRSLAKLRDDGLITDEEFETKRAELLARM